MADHLKPALTDTYVNFLAYMMARIDDAVKLAESTTNPLTGHIQWVVASNKLQRWSGAAWVDLVLSAAGGGTGGTTSLGTMAFQAASAVAITGGTLDGITSLDMHGHITFETDGLYDLGTSAKKARAAYIKTTLVIPTEA